MEKIADTIEKIFQEKLSLYETLKMVFEQETRCIADMDVDSLWEIAERKNQLVTDIYSLNEKLCCFLETHHITITPEMRSSALSHVIQKLPMAPNGQTCQNERRATNSCARLVERQILRQSPQVPRQSLARRRAFPLR